MRVFAINDSRFEYYDKPCVACPERTRVGDVVLVVDQGEKVFVHRELVWHRHCIEAALAGAPAERNEVTEFKERLRASVAATGRTPIAALLGG